MRATSWLGFLCVAIVWLAVLASATAYSGAYGEAYSFLNHNISELGEIGVSERAGVFNAALIVGGALYALFVIGLGVSGRSWGVYAASAVGLVSALALMMVGVFPIGPDESLASHTIAALTFFLSGMLYALLLTLALLFDRRTPLPRWLALPSAAVFVSYLAFLFLPRLLLDDLGAEAMLAGPSGPDRPGFWLPSFLEWLILFAVSAWVLIIAWQLRAQAAAERGRSSS